MKIVVCISSVPDTTAKITFTDDDTKFNKAGVTHIIGPYDELALARAVELKEHTQGSVTVLHVGAADSEPQIRKALAIGADEAIRVDAEPTDAWFVAQQIAHVVRQHAFDLIIMGRESIDYNSGIVHGLVGGLLHIPSFSPVVELELVADQLHIARETEEGKEFIVSALPAVVGCQEPIAISTIPTMKGIMTARKKPLHVVAAVEVAHTTNTVKYQLPKPKEACRFVPPEEAEKLIDLLRHEAKVL